MSTFLDRLKQAMEKSGKTKTDLWDGCGLTSGAVSQWFSKPTTQLKGKNLLCVSRLLGVNPDWLATGAGEMHEGVSPAIADEAEKLSNEQKKLLRIAERLDKGSFDALLRIASLLPADEKKIGGRRIGGERRQRENTAKVERRHITLHVNEKGGR